MRQINSVTIGLLEALPSSTGTQLGETGYAALPSTQSPGPQFLTPVPGYLTGILTESNRSLLASIKERKLPGDMARYAAEQQITTMIEQVQQLQEPVSPDRVVKSLAAMASMFGAELPDEIGLMMYVRALDGIPHAVFTAAIEQVTRTHKYPRLPLPADINAAAQPKIELLDAVEKMLHVAAYRLRFIQ